MNTSTAHRDPSTNPDRYWWHKAIVTEVRRIQDVTGQQTNIGAIASNLGMSRLDVSHYVVQLIEWGELQETTPAWDYPSLWVKLPD